MLINVPDHLYTSAWNLRSSIEGNSGPMAA